mgnify:CR=1 FL=1
MLRTPVKVRYYLFNSLDCMTEYLSIFYTKINYVKWLKAGSAFNG